MASKSPSITFTTPAGIAQWAFLDEPTLNFNKDGHEYRVDLVLSAEDAAPVIAKIDALFEANLASVRQEVGPAKAKQVKASPHSPYSNECDDKGNETGNIVFKAKLPASVTRQSDSKVFVMRPQLFDSAGQPCPTAQIGSGSVIKLAVEARGYYVASNGAGVKLSLKAVQVIKLVKKGQKDANDFGFDSSASDDGFRSSFGGDGDGAQAPAGGDVDNGGDY